MTELEIVDFHNHCIPGVDDGARDLEDARAALAAFRDQGVGTVITTPHFEAATIVRYEGGRARARGILEAFDEGWERLVEMARAEFPDLRLERGAEVKLNDPGPDLSDPRLRLAGTSFALVEFPAFQAPPHGDAQLAELVEAGWRPVVAHPERYRGATLEKIASWRSAGARLQVNGRTLVDDYGPGPRELAFELLTRGWVDYLSSDYHARGEPVVRDAWRVIAESGGEEQARLLMVTNPARLLEDREPLPVAALPRRTGVWDRIREMLS